MRPPGEDSLVSVKEASQKDQDVELLTLVLRHDAEGICEAPIHIHRLVALGRHSPIVVMMI
jgi:hypothetical protein